MRETWFLRAERAWGRQCATLRDVLAEAWGVARREPKRLAVLVVVLLALRSSMSLLPVESLRGAWLHTIAWATSFLSSLIFLAVLVAGLHLGVSRLRGREPDFTRLARVAPCHTDWCGPCCSATSCRLCAGALSPGLRRCFP